MIKTKMTKKKEVYCWIQIA